MFGKRLKKYNFTESEDHRLVIIDSYDSKYYCDSSSPSILLNKFMDKSAFVYKRDLPQAMPELRDFLILCKWPNCDSLVNQEDLDAHQQLCDRRIRPCRWMNCKEFVAQRELLSHESTCIRRDDTEYVCYFHRCYWRGGNRNLLQHLHQKHHDMLIQEPTVGGSVEKGSGWHTWYIFVYDELFRCGFGYYNEGDIYYQCIYVGPEVIGQRFDMEFEITNTVTGDSLVFVDDTAHLQPGHLHRDKVCKFDVNDWLHYTFRVIKKFKDEDEADGDGEASTSKEEAAAKDEEGASASGAKSKPIGDASDSNSEIAAAGASSATESDDGLMEMAGALLRLCDPHNPQPSTSSGRISTSSSNAASPRARANSSSSEEEVVETRM